MLVRKNLLLLSCIFLLLTLSQPQSVNAQSAVTLVTLSAYWQDANSVIISWETATEFDNAGFYINRSDAQPGPYYRFSEFIPTQSDGISGALYAWIDTNAVQGGNYYYKLEMINTSGESDYSQVFIPVANNSTPLPTLTPTNTVPPSTTPSPTVTSMITETNTPTVSPTNGPSPSPTVSLTPTVTPSGPTATKNPNLPTSTRTPPPTPTQRATTPVTPTELTPTANTQTLEATPKDTATLIPLPQLTIELPVLTPTSTKDSPTAQSAVTETLTGGSGAQATEAGNTSLQPKVPSRMAFLITIVVILWVFLGGLLFFFFRRLNNS
jgi:hypothetical protein